MKFKNFVDDYYRSFTAVIETFDKSAMPDALAIFTRVAYAGGAVWVGGSAAISSHTVFGTSKLSHVAGKPAVKWVSLALTGQMQTAFANGYAYEDEFTNA